MFEEEEKNILGQNFSATKYSDGCEIAFVAPIAWDSRQRHFVNIAIYKCNNCEIISKFESHWSHELTVRNTGWGLSWKYYLCLNEDELELEHEHVEMSEDEIELNMNMNMKYSCNKICKWTHNLN